MWTGSSGSVLLLCALRVSLRTSLRLTASSFDHHCFWYGEGLVLGILVSITSERAWVSSLRRVLNSLIVHISSRESSSSSLIAISSLTASQSAALKLGLGTSA